MSRRAAGRGRIELPGRGDRARRRARPLRRPVFTSATPAHHRGHTTAALAAAASAVFLFSAAAVGLAARDPDVASTTGSYDTLANRSTATFEPDGPGAPGGGGRPGVTSTPTRGGADPVYRTASNPLSTAGLPLPDVPCTLPDWHDDPAGARRYFRAALPCLNAAWKSVLRQANLPFEPPNLAFPRGGRWNSPCGEVSSASAAAFYCGGNDTIYMPYRGLQTADLGDQPAIYLAVLAHEYGHHVQNLAGIADAWAERAYELGGYGTESALRLSRRAELQAQCFSGQFLAGAEATGAISAAAASNAIRNHYERGDRRGGRRDHGSPAHYGGWMQRGYRHDNTTACNTWVSPASDVS